MEEAESVATTDRKESPLEGLILSRDRCVEEVLDVKVDKLSPIGVRHRSVLAVCTERDACDTAITLCLGYKVSAKSCFDIAFESQQVAKATCQGWSEFCEVV